MVSIKYLSDQHMINFWCPKYQALYDEFDCLEESSKICHSNVLKSYCSWETLQRLPHTYVDFQWRQSGQKCGCKRGQGREFRGNFHAKDLFRTGQKTCRCMLWYTTGANASTAAISLVPSIDFCNLSFLLSDRLNHEMKHIFVF